MLPLLLVLWLPIVFGDLSVVVQLQSVAATMNVSSLQASLQGVAQVNMLSDSGQYTLLTFSCTRGGFCPPGLGSQIPCPLGSFQPLSNQQSASACLPCPAGSHGPAVGLSRCAACPAGAWCGPAVSAPLVCAAGMYSPGNASVCLPCPPGYFCPAGSSAPSPCANGTYGPSAALSACKPCPSGTACGVAATAFTTCNPGEFSAVVACVPCPAGQYQPSSGSSACVPCPAGQFCPTGARNGTACGPLTYSPTVGQSACTPCGAGTFGPSTAVGRTANCPPCAAGFYCPTPLQAVQCPANTNSPAGTSSILGCACNGGYTCGYYRTVSISFSLSNVSLSDFRDDVNGVQTTFLQGVARAAGVAATSVTLVSINSLDQRRGGVRVAVRIDPPESVHLDGLRRHKGYHSHKVFV